MQVTALDNLRTQKGLLQRASSRLEKGGLVAIPTETGYRWLARADHPTAVAQLLSHRELTPDRPLGILCQTAAQARLLATGWDEGTSHLAELFWPGPLALLCRRDQEWKVPELLEPIRKIMLRVPQHPVPQDLLKLCAFRVFSLGIRDRGGRAVTHPSQIPDCQRWVTQLEPDSVEALVWREPCLSLEATIVDVSGRPPRVMRSGFVTSRELRSCLGPQLIFSGDCATPRQFSREFSSLHTILVEGDSKRVARRLRTLLESSSSSQRVALIVSKATGEAAFTPVPPGLAYYSTYDADDEGAVLEQNLFETLRHIEQKVRADLLLIEGPPREGPGLAILERLHHAANESINTDAPGYSGQAGLLEREQEYGRPGSGLDTPRYLEEPLDAVDEQSVSELGLEPG
jgi:L-threonylcarbamoyladenylate synthase